ncbi:hypothetical protein A2U01_0057671, partial [Trifolium medium]|nr:hypothetical protein [Trifolium medium]
MQRHGIREAGWVNGGTAISAMPVHVAAFPIPPSRHFLQARQFLSTEGHYGKSFDR